MTLQSDVDSAISVLRNGGIIALPTDTLYALAANARDDGAVRRVYAIKVRDQGKPLPLLVGGLAMAQSIGVLNEAANSLAERFWPGALTIVVQRQASFHSEALAGGETTGLRHPDSRIVETVVEVLGSPVTGTSANRSGGADPVTADEVRAELGDELDFILDAGPCPGGRSSTVVDCTGSAVKLLRSGAVTPEDIEAVLGVPLVRTGD